MRSRYGPLCCCQWNRQGMPCPPKRPGPCNGGRLGMVLSTIPSGACSGFCPGNHRWLPDGRSRWICRRGAAAGKDQNVLRSRNVWQRRGKSRVLVTCSAVAIARTATPAAIPPPTTAPAAASPLVMPAALNPTTEPPKKRAAKLATPPTPTPRAPASTSGMADWEMVRDQL